MRARTEILVVLAIVGSTAIAHAQAVRAKYRLEGGRPHTDVPFNIDVVVDGFDEAPAPDQPTLEIAGATVTPAGAQPNVSRSIQIINGRRQDSTSVTWVLRWRVLVHKEGTLRVPALTVSQGSKSATAAAGEASVDTVPTTDEMTVELVLPNRPVFTGETVPVKLVWLFQNQPEDQSFTVPMMSLDTFTIGGPPVTAGSRKVLQFAAGAKDLTLPYELDATTVNGTKVNRLTVTFYATPKTVPPGGKVELPPASVIAALPVGRADFFGRSDSRLFRASDIARTLEVKALPETGRPTSFVGAVGEQFSIEVRTSRSVVSLGEPVQLDIQVKSDQRLDTLSLGKLDGADRLPKDRFMVPAEPPTGELSADGKTKTFTVVAQVTGPATEVPALAFSYFDPRKASYQTIHSEPIALSVKGGTIVGAQDVVGGIKRPQAADPVDDTTLVTAELALSSDAQVDARPLGGALLWLLVGLLYAVPLGLFAFRSWQLRTAGSREEASEARAARRRVEELLDRAKDAPARDVAGPLAASLRELARVLGRELGEHAALLAKLETESFAPDASGKPLSPDLRSDSAGLLRRWATDARRARAGTNAGAVASMVLGMLLGSAGGSARADTSAISPPRGDVLSDGRAAYQDAMQHTGDPTARKAAFARATIALGEAARAHPDQPELLADWGNAALGAGDVATATLAYRRALIVDGGNARALRNLGYLRARQSESFRPSATATATDTLLFFHRWPRARRLLVGAAAFAIAILILMPRSGRRRRGTGVLALVPLAVWIAMLASVVFEGRHTGDAVVMDGVVLRAADSAGAPAALTQALPRGAEVTIIERRAEWTRIQLANGIVGWVPQSAVEPVTQ
ncbi:MAG: Tetratricopeptide 2 repeat protein [Deltaproteobacteria bacterium]|nr:Tetratricopeptide 2 repeat protein [Deltaproteobacteria bacterium]